MANNFLRRLAGGGNWRQWAMRAMGWLHLTLPLALAGCTFYRFLHGGDDLGGVYLWTWPPSVSPPCGSFSWPAWASAA